LTSDPALSAVTVRDFERLAADTLDQSAFDYIAGGAGDERTLVANEAAFGSWQLRPRVLVDVAAVDTATTLLGQPVSAPFGVAPVAFQHFAHPDAEPALARAAASAGITYCLSTMSSRSMEEVADAADAGPGGGPRWFQLYVHRDRARSASLVARAAAAGYGALVLTVDLPVAGSRDRDLRNRLAYPQTFGNFPPTVAGDAGDDSIAVTIGELNDASFTWADLTWLRSLSDMPLVVKGILTAEDAELAVAHGAAAVIVSNHGGRQLDRTPPAIAVLPEVVDAVGGRAEVYADGGIRRGADVLVALALGARGVFIGRPAVYGLAVGGESGARRVLDILAAELRTAMALLGVTRPDEVTAQHVRRA